MAAGTGSLRDHIFNQKHRKKGLKARQGYESSKPAHVDVLALSSKATCPEGSRTLKNSFTNWGPTVEIPEPLGDIPHSNHHIVCGELLTVRAGILC